MNNFCKQRLPLGETFGEVIIVVVLTHFSVDFRQLMQRIPIQLPFSHISKSGYMLEMLIIEFRGGKIPDIPDEILYRNPNLIQIPRNMTQHLLTHRNINRITTRRNPKPHSINPHKRTFLGSRQHPHQLCWTRYIAQTLGHFPRILVEDKAVCDDGLVGCGPTHGKRCKEGGLKPPTMLICSLEI